jgi:UDP-GlcNAc:undecaprenyl-phosphate GlcNAc-1-phosphate transferase
MIFDTPNGLVFLIAGALLAFGSCFPLATLLSRAGVMDVPNSRSSHEKPTVRGGGIGIVFSLLVCGTMLTTQANGRPLLPILVAALGLATISLIDDIRSLPAIGRLGCHFLAALVGLAALGWPQLRIASWSLSPWVGVPLLCFWVAGYTNAFNFMDGINGIAAGQAAVAGIGTAFLFWAAFGRWDETNVQFDLALAGAAIGFLPHNFPRAKMFMGDVGSAPLGYLQAILVCWIGLGHDGRLFWPLILLHANFILDTSITLMRRLGRGASIHQAHRDHFYQELVRAGWPHAFVTRIEMSLQIFIIALLGSVVWCRMLSLTVAAAIIIAVWLGFFAFCESRFRNSMRARENQPSI